MEREPRLQELQAEIEVLKRVGTQSSTLRETQNELKRYRDKLERKTLRQFQEQWMKERRQWKILSRGKIPATDSHSSDLFNIICSLIPERGRLATLMASKTPLSSADMWGAIRDLIALCKYDHTVAYLPDHEPIDGRCPVHGCGQQLDRQVGPYHWT